MKIIYPPLVEEGFSFVRSEAYSKAAFYRAMVRRGLITATGEPTPQALEKGWVKDFYEAENLSFEAFLQLYPYFRRHSQNEFQLIDGFWEVTLEFKAFLEAEISNNKLNFDEYQQISSYLEERSDD